MVDILESLKTAQRLKEINNTSVIDKNHNLQDGFIKAAKSSNWTQQMIDKFAELVNQQKGKKNNIIDIAFSTLFKDLVAQPQNYGIKPLTGESLNIANRVIKNPYTASQGVKSGKNNGRTNPWEVVIKVEPASTELALTAGNQLQTTNVEKALTNVDKNSIQEYNSDETTNKASNIDINKGLIIWPLNPFLPNLQKTDAIINELKKPIYQGCTIITTSINKGGDGHFDLNSYVECLHHRKGTALINHFNENVPTITSWKTFAVLIAQKIKETIAIKNLRTFALKEANEEGVETVSPSAGVSKFNTSLHNANIGKGVITIYCSTEVYNQLGPIKEMLWENNKIKISPQIVKAFDDPELGPAGKEIFNTFLEYINGKKTGSAAAQDTQDTKTSQKINESHLKEDIEIDWSWESIKANSGAKQYITRLFSAVEAIKDGLDDGGNPSMASRVMKQVVTEVGKEWGAALTDGADFMMQGIGLGWMMPLIKAGIDKRREEAGKHEYEGLEALVRSTEFQAIANKYFGNQRDFIESESDNN